MPAAFTSFVMMIEVAFLLGGVGLLGRFLLNRERRSPPARLPRWDVSGSDFLLFICLVVTGMFLVSATATTVLKSMEITGTAAVIIAGGGAQFGLLLGVGFYHFGFGHKLTVPVTGKSNALVSGMITFLAALPIVALVSIVWRAFLRAAGLPTESQDLVGMFARAESPLLLAIMMTLAVLVAPLAEELVFRAGLFRYLRTRLPRAAALLLPSVVFSLLHGNYASFGPLVALAIVFSLAYERTGRIGTTVVAHALFNLNTVMVIFSGIDTIK